MKVVHIESGLGNQMLGYCEYLALKALHPDEKCYIETLVYDIPECNDVICQWNGYELERIFGIHAPNIRECFSDQEWKNILASVHASEFWRKAWNWPVYISRAFSDGGLKLRNISGDFEQVKVDWSYNKTETPPLKYRIKQTGTYQNIRRIYKSLRPDKYCVSDRENLFYSGNDDIYTGQRLTFKFIGNDIEKIDAELRAAFRFPEIEDEANRTCLKQLQFCNSVAIHARRGDMLSCNGKYYRSGFFKRAVRYIKKHVENPVFFFFCDPGSIDWCRNNEKIFGLDFRKDQVHFVDWNKGTESYRDMQLMSHCRHNIITNSSFGWWGAYLNPNPDKITISPEIEINTTYHC